ncbi:MAG: tRNA 2-thiocytidine biosynthesis protein TtcA [Clostridia bacterium]|nr:tRNA 2-thiocytidine biosynthesis protein TtcA [Clostridia bacterium]
MGTIPGRRKVSKTDFTPAEAAVRSVLKKYRKEIWAPFISAIKEYRLIEEGDVIGVCISGGKDSALLAVLMKQLQRYSDVPFRCEFICMDPGYSPDNRRRIEKNMALLEIPVHIFETNIFRVTSKTDKSPCYLCARMRRGHLYSFAKSLGCNKIALGHHFSDVIETTLMGMLWGAQIQAMLPKLHSTNFEGMELIRPLYKVHEDHIIAWARYNSLSFLACACVMTESANLDENASKRRQTKMLIRELKKDCPDVEKNIFNSIHKSNIYTMVGYKRFGVLHSFLEDYDRITEQEDEQ